MTTYATTDFFQPKVAGHFRLHTTSIPVETGTGLSLNISENDNALDLNLALSVAPYFRLDEKKVNTIIEQIKNSVSNWRSVATDIGISRQEQDIMKSAFE